MRPLLHRSPGPLAAIARAEGVRGELIADGVHVHPGAMNALVKLLGPERTIVITDALAAAGIPQANFDFAGQPAQVIRGAARLSDGTITGSVLTMDQALRNVLQMTEVSLQQAVGMLTLNPAQAAQVSQRKGRLEVGYDADLLIFDGCEPPVSRSGCISRIPRAAGECQQNPENTGVNRGREKIQDAGPITGAATGMQERPPEE